MLFLVFLKNTSRRVVHLKNVRHEDTGGGECKIKVNVSCSTDHGGMALRHRLTGAGGKLIKRSMILNRESGEI